LPQPGIIEVRARSLREPEQLEAIKAALDRLIDSGKDRLILDLTGVATLDSAAYVVLLTMRRKLQHNLVTQGKPCPDCGLGGPGPVFPLFQDQAEALEAVQKRDPGVLLLCGVSSEIRKVVEDIIRC
jgi:anti-anti-sigma regulatory factor